MHEQWPSSGASGNFGLLADIFGWIEHDDDGQNRTWTLTSPGRQAALMGLQLQARTPRNCVWPLLRNHWRCGDGAGSAGRP